MSIILAPKDYAFDKVLALITEAFTEQNGKIDPPSSMNKLTVADIKVHARSELIWIDDANHPTACMFGTHQKDALYLSKLSVAKAARGKGLARHLIAQAANYARTKGISKLTLISRIELTQNHALFAHLGFEKTGYGSHEGYDRPTEIHFERDL